MKGIYKYTDLKTGEIVYIGKDSRIDKNQRHKDHLYPSNYDQQQINRVLQNNPDRYEYSVIWATEDCTDLKLNKMEILFGKIYNPKFNFGKFGAGGRNKGFKVSEETKNKISVTNSGKNNPFYGKKHNMETKKKLSKAKKGENNPNYGKTGENHPKWKPYAHIIKYGKQKGKQYYIVMFNGKKIKKSISISKLMDWFSKEYPTEILKIPNSIISELKKGNDYL